MVPARGRPEAGAEEPGAGLSRPRGERAADRPHQLPGGRPGRQPRLRRATPSAGWSPSRSCWTTAVAGSWTTFTNKGYDAVWTRDNTGTSGRLHHLSFAVDSRDDIIRAADLALEHGIHIETGPHKHTIQQSFFLYVWEPAGNRIELDNAGARLVFAPDWQPVDWSAEERAKGQAWGLQTISTFHTHGTPPVQPEADRE